MPMYVEARGWLQLFSLMALQLMFNFFLRQTLTCSLDFYWNSPGNSGWPWWSTCPRPMNAEIIVLSYYNFCLTFEICLSLNFQLTNLVRQLSIKSQGSPYLHHFVLTLQTCVAMTGMDVEDLIQVFMLIASTFYQLSHLSASFLF